MRVFFDDRRAVYAPHTGIGCYAALCLRGLQERPDVTPVRAAEKLKGLASSGINESAWIRKLIADQVGMPFAGRAVDIHHAVWQETSPLIRVPLVLTIHDLSMQTSPESFSRFQRAYYGNLLRVLVRRARVIVVPSQATADDVASWCPGIQPQIAANPIDPIFLSGDGGVVDTGATDLPDSPYLLYTGGQHVRKDLVTLLRGTAIAQNSGEFDGSLVVTGPASANFVKLSRYCNCRVTFTGVVESTRLRDLYLGAAAVITASFNEGFGYSAAEAIACGKAIACPDRGATLETARSAAVIFEPGNADDLARAIVRVANPDAELCAAIDAERAVIGDRFSVQRAAEDLHNCYQLAV